MIIAVTGRIGSGKSAFSQMLTKYGFTVVDVDSLGHGLLQRADVSEKLRAEFGMKIMGRNLMIEREKLRKEVFNDGKLLRRLNEIVHPYLKDEIKKKLKSVRGNVVLDAALFEELEIGEFSDKVVLVQTDITNIYERLNPQYSKKEILTVMNSQAQASRVDYIIENNGTVEDLKRKAAQLVNKLF